MYTISEAAERAGLSVEVLRAWERRYGVVTPQRTEAGYRLYDAPTIERLQAMRRLVEDGWTPSAAAASLRGVSDAELAAAAPRVPADGEGGEAGLSERFVSAAAAMDPSATQEVLDEMGARASFERMVDRYLFPALHALGDAWASGRISVAAEHAASAAVARWLGAIYDAAGSNGRDDRPILFGLPPGAHHELGAMAHATAARRAGLAVAYIGADVPVPDWIKAAETTEASLAVIGVPTSADRAAAHDVARALARRVPSMGLAFGGAGAAGMRRGRVLSPGVRDAVRELESLRR
jgi:DNA-binding transcriptional MerR regulator